MTVLSLCIVVCPMLGTFIYQHLTMIKEGLTTNEVVKLKREKFELGRTNRFLAEWIMVVWLNFPIGAAEARPGGTRVDKLLKD